MLVLSVDDRGVFRKLGGLSALVAILTACASSSAPSLARVNAAATKLDTDVGAYLAVGNHQPPNDAAGWQAFFDQGDRLVAQLRQDYDAWSPLVDQVVASGQNPVWRGVNIRQYRDAVGTWITDQENQARMSRHCFLGSETVEMASSCYEQMLASYGTQWQSDSDRLEAMAKSLKLGR